MVTHLLENASPPEAHPSYRHIVAWRAGCAEPLGIITLQQPSGGGSLHSEQYFDLKAFRGPRDGEILKLLTVDPGRHPSLGAVLMHRAFLVCLEEGVDHVFANCLPTMLPMYEKVGFREVAREVDYGNVCVYLRQDVRAMADSAWWTRFHQRMQRLVRADLLESIGVG